MQVQSAGSQVVFKGADSWVTFLGKAKPVAPVSMELPDVQVSAAPAQEKVIQTIRAAAKTAMAKGNGELGGMLGSVAEMIETGQHPDRIREGVAKARDANKEKPDFTVTRALLAAGRLAHDESGDAIGVKPVAQTKAIGDEDRIALAAEAALKKFGGVKGLPSDEPSRPITPAQVVTVKKQLS